MYIGRNVPRRPVISFVPPCVHLSHNLNFRHHPLLSNRYGPAGVGLMVAFLTVMGIVLLNLLIAFLTGAHSETRKLAKAKV